MEDKKLNEKESLELITQMYRIRVGIWTQVAETCF